MKKKRKPSMRVPVRLRRSGVLSNLQDQLKRGTKTAKKSVDKMIPLTDKDKKRITNEIEILKARI